MHFDSEDIFRLWSMYNVGTYLIKRKVRCVIRIYYFVVGLKKIIFYLKLRTKHVPDTFIPLLHLNS